MATGVIQTMPDTIEAKWAVYNNVEHAWLIDTGVGGTYSTSVEDAQWWNDPDSALAELEATEINEPHVFWIVRVK